MQLPDATECSQEKESPRRSIFISLDRKRRKKFPAVEPPRARLFKAWIAGVVDGVSMQKKKFFFSTGKEGGEHGKGAAVPARRKYARLEAALCERASQQGRTPFLLRTTFHFTFRRIQR